MIGAKMVAAPPLMVSAVTIWVVRMRTGQPSGGVESGVRVTRSMFDDPKLRDQAREDYYQIGYRVGEVNLRPFVKALSSLLKDHVERSAGTRRSTAGSETPSSRPSA